MTKIRKINNIRKSNATKNFENPFLAQFKNRNYNQNNMWENELIIGLFPKKLGMNNFFLLFQIQTSGREVALSQWFFDKKRHKDVVEGKRSSKFFLKKRKTRKNSIKENKNRLAFITVLIRDIMQSLFNEKLLTLFYF